MCYHSCMWIVPPFLMIQMFLSFVTSFLPSRDNCIFKFNIIRISPLLFLLQAFRPFTREGRRPTPVLISGLERRCSVDLAPNAAQGRPNGLYGNAFASAEPGAVSRAVKVCCCSFFSSSSFLITMNSFAAHSTTNCNQYDMHCSPWI